MSKIDELTKEIYEFLYNELEDNSPERILEAFDVWMCITKEMVKLKGTREAFEEQIKNESINDAELHDKVFPSDTSSASMQKPVWIVKKEDE